MTGRSRPLNRRIVSKRITSRGAPAPDARPARGAGRVVDRGVPEDLVAEPPRSVQTAESSSRRPVRTAISRANTLIDPQPVETRAERLERGGLAVGLDQLRRSAVVRSAIGREPAASEARDERRGSAAAFRQLRSSGNSGEAEAADDVVAVDRLRRVVEHVQDVLLRRRSSRASSDEQPAGVEVLALVDHDRVVPATELADRVVERVRERLRRTSPGGTGSGSAAACPPREPRSSQSWWKVLTSSSPVAGRRLDGEVRQHRARAAS